MTRPRAATGTGGWRKASKDNEDARGVFLCHSMGGLVARYYLEACGGAELCRAPITLGTPYRGSLDALSRLVNGVSFKLGGLGPDLTRLARTLPSLHQFVPHCACLEVGGELKYPRELNGGLPRVDDELLTDAARLHQEIAKPEERPRPTRSSPPGDCNSPSSPPRSSTSAANWWARS
nr:hypothetical protein [Thermomonospora curvata]